MVVGDWNGVTWIGNHFEIFKDGKFTTDFEKDNSWEGEIWVDLHNNDVDLFGGNFASNLLPKHHVGKLKDEKTVEFTNTKGRKSEISKAYVPKDSSDPKIKKKDQKFPIDKKDEKSP